MPQDSRHEFPAFLTKTAELDLRSLTPVPRFPLCSSWKGAGMMQVHFNGKRFKTERKQCKISQIRLAEQAETTERYLRGLEHGRKEYSSAAMVYRLSNALKIWMEDLMLVWEDEE